MEMATVAVDPVTRAMMEDAIGGRHVFADVEQITRLHLILRDFVALRIHIQAASKHLAVNVNLTTLRRGYMTAVVTDAGIILGCVIVL